MQGLLVLLKVTRCTSYSCPCLTAGSSMQRLAHTLEHAPGNILAFLLELLQYMTAGLEEGSCVRNSSSMTDTR